MHYGCLVNGRMVIDAGFFETEVAPIIRSYTYVRNYRNEFRMRWQDKTMGIAGLFIL